MIRAQEIRNLAMTEHVHPHVIEKDYVLGWVLAALFQNPLSRNWLFKGGTCLKKCYFKNYRFSEDLDFSTPEPLSRTSLEELHEDVTRWLYTQTGIKISQTRLQSFALIRSN